MDRKLFDKWWAETPELPEEKFRKRHEKVVGGFTVRIYKIWRGEEPTICYIGSTQNPVDKRMKKHMYDARKGSECEVHKWMREHDLDFLYKEVDKKVVYSGEERAKLEQLYINKFTPILNMVDAYAKHLDEEELREKTAYEQFEYDNNLTKKENLALEATAFFA